MAEAALCGASSDQGLTADEYARENGLSCNSRSDIVPLSSSYPCLFKLDHFRCAEDPLEDSGDLRKLQLPPLSLIEQTSITKASAGLMSMVVMKEDDEKIKELTNAISMTTRGRGMKLQLPLLRTNHESDCRELARSIQQRKTALLKESSLPFEPLIASQDETFEFPESAHVYRHELMAAIDNDRIAVTREIIGCLENALAAIQKDGGAAKFLSKEMPSRRASFAPRVAKLTPQLSPLIGSRDFFIPDPSVCQIPVSSDPSTLFGADLDAAHAALLQDESSPPRFGTPELLQSEDMPRMSPTLPNINSLKVEGPLTPLDSTNLSPDQVVNVGQAASALQLDHGLADLEADLHSEVASLFSDELLEVLREGAMHAVRSIEQERLEPTDATARVRIPIMDFTLPEPAWHKSDLEPSSIFHLLMGSSNSVRVPKWPRDAQAELQMWWNPFPSSLGQISMRELIEEEDDLQSLLNSIHPTNIPGSSAYVWKQPGLSILRNPDDDEDLEEARLQTSTNEDLQPLVRKRKLMPESTAIVVPESPDQPPRLDSIRTFGTEQRPIGSEPVAGIPPLRLLVGMNDPSATSTLLANYVGLHTSKKQKLGSSYFFPPSEPSKATAKTDNIVTIKPTKSEPKRESTPLPTVVTLAPIPTATSEHEPTSIIIALTLGRGIITSIEKLLPAVKMAERDFDRWNTSTWDRNSVSRSPVVSPLAAEADIAVSPTTGIVITTLIRAIQKPLPGHKGKAAIRERVEKISTRYERLIILVSEANRIDASARDLSPSECAAISDFVGFVSGLGMNAQVQYVGGGEETLSKWLAYFITKYSPETTKVQDMLIVDETTWELVLRRAGMNAFAAQIVLGMLKAPDDTAGEAMGRYGLAGFINMSAAKRLQEFGQLLGGESVLQRVGAVLDSRWN
ncbi:hypothetical protein BJ170DRAFT_718682 [Xylariales sp. AK1849]|nr:hypothetical protein BJ170DRAFT_718682 [Xylariales sp. AK1849]